jgi:hypothetical protein
MHSSLDEHLYEINYTSVFTSNSGPNNVPTQPNKHISKKKKTKSEF